MIENEKCERDSCGNRKVTTFSNASAEDISFASHRNSLYMSTKNGKTSRWIHKLPESPIIEVWIQEFYRWLIRGAQPKTRLIKYDEKLYATASKVVENYVPLSDISDDSCKHILLSDSAIKSLAQIMATALFTKELDLKKGNILVDIDRETNTIRSFAKIDGENACSRRMYITKQAVASPFYPFTVNNDIRVKASSLNRDQKLFLPYNWFTAICYLSEHDEIVVRAKESDEKLSFSNFKLEQPFNNETFKQTYFLTIIILICLPVSFFKLFLSQYKYEPKIIMEKNIEAICAYFQRLQAQLKNAVRSNQDFLTIVADESTEKSLLESCIRMVSFTPIHKKELFTDDTDKIKCWEELMRKYGELKTISPTSAHSEISLHL